MNCLHRRVFNGDPKVHYKMFKSGRVWVFTAMATVAFVGGTPVLVRAAQPESTKVTTTQVTTPTSSTAAYQTKVAAIDQHAVAQSNQQNDSSSTTPQSGGYTNQNEAVKNSSQSTAPTSEKSKAIISVARPDNVKTRMAAPASAPKTGQVTQPIPAKKSQAITKATSMTTATDATIRQANTAASYAQAASSYAQVVQTPAMQAALKAANSAYQEAQTQAKFTQHYESLANMYAQVIRDQSSAATTLQANYDSAVKQVDAAVKANALATAQTERAAAVARQEAIKGLSQQANSYYQQNSQAVGQAQSAAQAASAAADRTYSDTQYDGPSHQVQTNYEQASSAAQVAAQAAQQVADTFDKLTNKLSVVNQAVTTQDYEAESAAFKLIENQVRQIATHLANAQNADSQAEHEFSLAHKTVIDDLKANAKAAQQATAQAARQAQQLAKQAQTYNGNQAKQYAGQVQSAANVINNQSVLLDSISTGIDETSDLQSIIAFTNQAMDTADAAAEQLKLANKAAQMAANFNTEVENARQDHDGAEITLSQSQTIGIDDPVKLTTNLNLGTGYINWGKTTYTWYQTTDKKTWKQVLQTNTGQASFSFPNAGPYYIQVVVSGNKVGILTNPNYLAASNVISLNVADGTGNYATQAQQAAQLANEYATQMSHTFSSASSAWTAAHSAATDVDFNSVSAAATADQDYQLLQQLATQAATANSNAQSAMHSAQVAEQNGQYAEARSAAQAATSYANTVSSATAAAKTAQNQFTQDLDVTLNAVVDAQNAAAHYLSLEYADTLQQLCQSVIDQAKPVKELVAAAQRAYDVSGSDHDGTEANLKVAVEAGNNIQGLVLSADEMINTMGYYIDRNDYQELKEKIAYFKTILTALNDRNKVVTNAANDVLQTIVTNQGKHYAALTEAASEQADSTSSTIKTIATQTNSLANKYANNTTLGNAYIAETREKVNTIYQLTTLVGNKKTAAAQALEDAIAAVSQGNFAAGSSYVAVASQATAAATAAAQAAASAAVENQQLLTKAQAYSADTKSFKYTGDRGNANVLLGMTLTNGMTTQPTKYTATRSGNTIHLSAASHLGIGSINGLTKSSGWWVLIDGTWQQVEKVNSKIFKATDDSRNGFDFSSLLMMNNSSGSTLEVHLADDYIGTLIFQWRAGYTGLGNLGLSLTTYTASDLAEVDVYDRDISATDLAIAGDDYIVSAPIQSKASKDGIVATSQYTVTTNPGNATGEVTWKTSDSNVAKVDGSGWVVAFATGTVDLIATITNSDGSQYTAVKHLTIGNGLQEQTISAGSQLQWSPDGAYTAENKQVSYQWYRTKDVLKDGNAIAGANQMTYIKDNVTVADGDYYYYVKITSNSSGKQTAIKLGPVKLIVQTAVTDLANVAVQQAQAATKEANDYDRVTQSYGEVASHNQAQNVETKGYVDRIGDENKKTTYNAQQAQAELDKAQQNAQAALAAELKGDNAGAKKYLAAAQAAAHNASDWRNKNADLAEAANDNAKSALAVVPTKPVTPSIPGTNTEKPDGNGDTNQSTGEGQKPDTNGGNGSGQSTGTGGQGTNAGDTNSSGGSTEVPGGTTTGNNGSNTNKPDGGTNPETPGSTGDGSHSTETPGGTTTGNNGSDTNKPDGGTSPETPGNTSDGNHSTETPGGTTTGNNGGNTNKPDGGTNPETPGNTGGGDHSTETPGGTTTGNNGSDTNKPDGGINPETPGNTGDGNHSTETPGGTTTGNNSGDTHNPDGNSNSEKPSGNGDHATGTPGSTTTGNNGSDTNKPNGGTNTESPNNNGNSTGTSGGTTTGNNTGNTNNSGNGTTPGSTGDGNQSTSNPDGGANPENPSGNDHSTGTPGGTTTGNNGGNTNKPDGGTSPETPGGTTAGNNGSDTDKPNGGTNSGTANGNGNSDHATEKPGGAATGNNGGDTNNPDGGSNPETPGNTSDGNHSTETPGSTTTGNNGSDTNKPNGGSNPEIPGNTSDGNHSTETPGGTTTGNNGSDTNKPDGGTNVETPNGNGDNSHSTGNSGGATTGNNAGNANNSGDGTKPGSTGNNGGDHSTGTPGGNTNNSSGTPGGVTTGNNGSDTNNPNGGTNPEAPNGNNGSSTGTPGGTATGNNGGDTDNPNSGTDPEHPSGNGDSDHSTGTTTGNNGSGNNNSNGGTTPETPGNTGNGDHATETPGGTITGNNGGNTNTSDGGTNSGSSSGDGHSAGNNGGNTNKPGSSTNPGNSSGNGEGTNKPNGGTNSEKPGSTGNNGHSTNTSGGTPSGNNGSDTNNPDGSVKPEVPGSNGDSNHSTGIPGGTTSGNNGNDSNKPNGGDSQSSGNTSGTTTGKPDTNTNHPDGNTNSGTSQGNGDTHTTGSVAPGDGDQHHNGGDTSTGNPGTTGTVEKPGKPNGSASENHGATTNPSKPVAPGQTVDINGGNHHPGSTTSKPDINNGANANLAGSGQENTSQTSNSHNGSQTGHGTTSEINSSHHQLSPDATASVMSQAEPDVIDQGSAVTNKPTLTTTQSNLATVTGLIDGKLLTDSSHTGITGTLSLPVTGKPDAATLVTVANGSLNRSQSDVRPVDLTSEVTEADAGMTKATTTQSDTLAKTDKAARHTIKGKLTPATTVQASAADHLKAAATSKATDAKTNIWFLLMSLVGAGFIYGWFRKRRQHD
ncbi:KxYKxGKxW signal peptide domain-containing protein [Lactiplantibacillus daowaiensis]|uniref:KxYKxGKxW signal peptide domain-containing protein n=1 Tax=Lactiplantibacillus daowaiensis TaxID=2559918 RepID=A0ABW1S1Q1_9LACO|nr:KxYKxGKxW signal peptide domain-containing protein [Lactiplantibacillus daowaiensis]